MTAVPHPSRLEWARSVVRLPDERLDSMDTLDAAAAILGDSHDPDDRTIAKYLRKWIGEKAVAEVNEDAREFNDAYSADIRAAQARSRWWLMVMALCAVSTIAGYLFVELVVGMAVEAGRIDATGGL